VAQQNVNVENATTQLAPIWVTQAPIPGSKFYFHSLTEISGVLAANNFISIFNPSASGKTLVFYQATVDAYATGAATVTTNMKVFRTTAASAGTLIAASTVNRFNTADANPVAEVRVGNPTTTNVGTALIGFIPAITTVGAGTGPTGNATVPSGAGFVCRPGEGIVYNTAAGDVDQLWNINVTWAEL